MIVSNEPGYYKEKKFGIRIENLIYVNKNKKNIQFKNLTLAPIDIDLINLRSFLVNFDISPPQDIIKHSIYSI